MEKRILILFFSVMIIVILAGCTSYVNLYDNDSNDSVVLRELSPCGNYTLLIEEIDEPDFPFGKDHLQVTLFEMLPEDERLVVYYRASFQADVANDGIKADYEIEWMENGVQIALIGSQ